MIASSVSGGALTHPAHIYTHYTQTAKHVSVSSDAHLTDTHPRPTDIANLLSVMIFAFYWFSMAPMGTVEHYPV